MKVSVVIPAFNEEAYIGSCLESLGRQSRPPAQIIVVDNNSTDQTAAIARRLGATVVAEPRQGISFARNRGFDLASGDIIARCDADSRLPSDWIKQIEANFHSHGLAGLTGPCVFYDGPSRFTLGYLHRLAVFQGSRRILGHDVLYGSNMAITSSAWQQVRGLVCYDEAAIHEDIDLAIHLNELGGRIRFDKQLVAAISFRRFKTSPPSLYSYLKRWPGTKLYHRRAISSEI